MPRALPIGGEPIAHLRADPPPLESPAILDATVVPGRGMMLLQAKLRLPSGMIVDAIASPQAAQAALALAGGPDDFAGNASFSFGGAILAPYANRIRGRPIAGSRVIETKIGDATVRLPRNWGGRAPGAEHYAMHGLILDRPIPAERLGPAHVRGRLEAGDFGGRWPGRMTLDVDWQLERGALKLRVVARNDGDCATPVGIGWHPYFNLNSARGDILLWLAGQARALVNNYDEVLPTGQITPTLDTPYDFSAPGGRRLGDLYLDDCYTDLAVAPSGVLAELRDPANQYGLRLLTSSSAIRAIQIYAPPDKAYVVVEPQFNLPDPFGSQWESADTGMAMLQPGNEATYEVILQPFEI